VGEAANKSLQSLKSVLWAGLWSTVLTTFIAFAIEANNRCFLIVNGAGWMWTISGLIWFWLWLFVLFGNRGRSILVGVTVFAFLAAPNVDRFPTAAGEARAVGHLRSLAQAVDAYRNDHATEGFPAGLPTISKGEDTESTHNLYKIDYTTSRSNSSGPIDGFLIQATPMWRECGFVRSFAIGDDRETHYTIEPRPATKSDNTIQ
jgi:hypothetical protein